MNTESDMSETKRTDERNVYVMRNSIGEWVSESDYKKLRAQLQRDLAAANERIDVLLPLKRQVTELLERAHEGDLNLRAAYKDLTRVEGQRDKADAEVRALREKVKYYESITTGAEHAAIDAAIASEAGKDSA